MTFLVWERVPRFAVFSAESCNVHLWCVHPYTKSLLSRIVLPGPHVFWILPVGFRLPSSHWWMNVNEDINRTTMWPIEPKLWLLPQNEVHYRDTAPNSLSPQTCVKVKYNPISCGFFDVCTTTPVGNPEEGGRGSRAPIVQFSDEIKGLARYLSIYLQLLMIL